MNDLVAEAKTLKSAQMEKWNMLKDCFRRTNHGLEDKNKENWISMLDYSFLKPNVNISKVAFWMSHKQYNWTWNLPMVWRRTTQMRKHATELTAISPGCA